MSEFALYADWLRKEGFRLDYKSKAGGCEVRIWQKTMRGRLVEVQLWADGRHRVSHMENGRSTTPPTEVDHFDDLPGAIEYESVCVIEMQRMRR